ncbi:MAG: tagaturonate reductase [Gemmatimonadaceae bacterium]
MTALGPRPSALGRRLISTGDFQSREDLIVPAPDRLAQRERAVQFGTGALLRGLVDYFLDEAGRAGRWDGRVVAIGSTGSGRDAAINEQDGLYTLVSRGVSNGRPVSETRVVGSVSRAVSAADDWDAVLRLARDPWIELVFSNTTEVGIVLDESDEPDLSPPRSFPGKLTRFLFERARAFAFSRHKGVVVIPCELLESNGDRLKAIVHALAERWALGRPFVRWLEEAVPFCNTLVDRIVPGAPPADERAALAERLGYEDAMLTACEPYRLLAIEPNGAPAERLRWASAEDGVVVTDDVTPYRERKVRLLNGAHTVMVPLALLAGCETVREAVEHEAVGAFLRRAMLDEILPGVRAPGADAFAREVLDRFANPHIRHALADITLQGTMKMKVRVVPSMLAHAERTGRAPAALALGLAAHLELLRDEHRALRKEDAQGERLRALWAEHGDDVAALVRAVCADTSLWDASLADIPGFVEAVTEHLARIRRDGALAAIDEALGLRPSALGG